MAVFVKQIGKKLFNPKQGPKNTYKCNEFNTSETIKSRIQRTTTLYKRRISKRSI